MVIPLNRPRGRPNDKRYRLRGGDSAADFPASKVVDEPINRDAH